MKIRTINDLINALDTDIAWRKYEMSALYSEIQRCRKEYIKRALIRAAVPILYSHWEGFVKYSSTVYIEYVSRKYLKYEELTPNFIALCCRSILRRMSESSKIDTHIEIVSLLTDGNKDKARIPFDDSIDTESNLSSRVLNTILTTIGVSGDDYWESKSLLIDGSLVRTRNEISHGENTDVDDDSYEILHNFVKDSIEFFKRQIENCACNKMYRKSL